MKASSLLLSARQGTNKPTALQEKEIADIRNAGGLLSYKRAKSNIVRFDT
jgi:hypothetical protein